MLSCCDCDSAAAAAVFRLSLTWCPVAVIILLSEGGSKGGATTGPAKGSEDAGFIDDSGADYVADDRKDPDVVLGDAEIEANADIEPSDSVVSEGADLVTKE